MPACSRSASEGKAPFKFTAEFPTSSDLGTAPGRARVPQAAAQSARRSARRGRQRCSPSSADRSQASGRVHHRSHAQVQRVQRRQVRGAAPDAARQDHRPMRPGRRRDRDGPAGGGATARAARARGRSVRRFAPEPLAPRSSSACSRRRARRLRLETRSVGVRAGARVRHQSRAQARRHCPQRSITEPRCASSCAPTPAGRAGLWRARRLALLPADTAAATQNLLRWRRRLSARGLLGWRVSRAEVRSRARAGGAPTAGGPGAQLACRQSDRAPPGDARSTKCRAPCPDQSAQQPRRVRMAHGVPVPGHCIRVTRRGARPNPQIPSRRHTSELQESEQGDDVASRHNLLSRTP